MNSKVSLILLFLAATALIFPKDDIKIISSDRNALVIEYTPIYTDTTREIIDNQEFIKVDILTGLVSETLTPGTPVIPQKIINIGVPSEYGNTVQLLSSTYKEIKGKVKPIALTGNSKKPKYEISPEYYNNEKKSEELVTFGEYGLIRDLPVQSLLINPVQFSASKNTIRLYTKILFRINFTQSQHHSPGYDDELARHSVINYEAAKYWGKRIKLSGPKKITAENSVLSSGKWVRVEAPSEGIYKITGTMLKSYGFDLSNLHPGRIKIYNNGGKMLPENIDAPRPSDLAEIAVEVIGGEDGIFNESDYILFYGRGINFWDVDTSDNTLKRFFNLYSKENYYWITVSGSNDGKRIGTKAGINETPQYTQTTTAAFADWEEDLINIGQTGRVFLGDEFSTSTRSKTYANSLNGRDASFPIAYKVHLVGATLSGSDSIKVLENERLIRSQLIPGYGSSYTYPEHAVGREYTLTGTYEGALQDNRSLLKLNFSPGGSNSKAYINYFEISYEKELRVFDDYLVFFSKSRDGIAEYQIREFSNSNSKVYDVTQYNDVKLITNPVIHSMGELRFRVNESSEALSKYIAFGLDNYAFLSPANPVEVSNSNLHGINPGAKYIIVTHKTFNEAAQRLKNYRQNEAKIRYPSIVVDVDEIYNEFGGGLKDPGAIRDFLKYAYDNWQIRPEYVLFFGLGTYDYKNIENTNNNFIPTWQSPNFVDHLVSYPSDDFFVKVSGTDNKIDLAPGRITNRSASDADLIVDKIIRYEKNNDTDLWRNLITLVSDDGVTLDGYEGAEHTAPNEILARTYFPRSFDFNKVYAAQYPFQPTSAGDRKPLASEAIIKAINDGTVLVNYIGHGNPNVWAHEYIFERQVTIPRLTNDKYFFLTAVTCDFGLFDNPGERSSAEDLLFLPNSGSIGAFTATRPVYSGPNHTLIYRFISKYFSGKDSLNLSYPVGYVNFLTKQELFSTNEQKYFIFGDPLLRINFPQYNAEIDSINGQSPSAANIQVKALGSTNISGRIMRPDASIWSDFNGEGILTVFDSQRDVHLDQINMNMQAQGGVIFRGRVSVTNGSFSANFIVPKDISYDNKNGKIVMYFYGNGIDGLGYTNNIIVGGTDETVVNDGKGPDVEIYFDDTSFEDSYLINPNSELIVKLSDETGLNTTGTGVGHKLEGILNEKENAPIDFTNYFKGDLNSGGKSGEINYRFNNLEQGEYKLQVKAWDVFNNFTEETTYFSVVNGDELVIRDVYNYPNPFTTNTTFTFQMNIDRDIDVRVKVYTIAGRLIREIERVNIREKFVKVDWDGRDGDGNNIANGTYLYKIIVNSVDGEFNSSVLGKMAVIR
ncbi:MAG: type IX secretion system sortase PorU [Ignavibacteriaceae bacterium]